MKFYDLLMEKGKEEGIIKNVVGGIVLNSQNEILIMTRKTDDFMGGIDELPSGNMDNGENIYQALIREIKEETNLDVAIDTRFREITTYSPKPEVLKDVIYFIAISKSDDVIIQKSELKASKWLDIHEALGLVTYEDDKKILKKAIKYIENNNL